MRQLKICECAEVEFCGAGGTHLIIALFHSLSPHPSGAQDTEHFTFIYKFLHYLHNSFNPTGDFWKQFNRKEMERKGRTYQCFEEAHD